MLVTSLKPPFEFLKAEVTMFWRTLVRILRIFGGCGHNSHAFDNPISTEFCQADSDVITSRDVE
jgi:hypothetical protein